MRFRSYDRSSDYENVGALLKRTFSDNAPFYNWLQPRWEYMHYHPLILSLDLTKAIILESAGNTVGIIHAEHNLGTAYIQIDPAFSSFRKELLIEGEKYLLHETKKELSIFINNIDKELELIALQLGYIKNDSVKDYMLVFDASSDIPSVLLPTGFSIKSLEDENDLQKISRVIHRGFNHAGEPPESHVDEIKFMQTAINFRKDLTVFVESDNKMIASYCGMWFDDTNLLSYVEPVATDPMFRRMGLGKAVVLESIRRCIKLGARKIFVGSNQAFYKSIGFKEKYRENIWTKKECHSTVHGSVAERPH
jgi:predicted N-acetyltransferase YhbS